MQNEPEGRDTGAKEMVAESLHRPKWEPTAKFTATGLEGGGDVRASEQTAAEPGRGCGRRAAKARARARARAGPGGRGRLSPVA